MPKEDTEWIRPDLKRAQANRERIRSKYATRWWEEMERARDSTPIDQPLPRGVPAADLPTINEQELRELEGEENDT